MPKIRKRKRKKNQRKPGVPVTEDQRKPGFPKDAGEKIDTLFELMGLTPRRLRSIFDSMVPAEEELTARGLTDARAGAKSLFYALRPSEPMRELRADGVYRCHVRELLDRYQAGEALEPGTRIECALVILECSKTAPLNRVGLATLAMAAAGSPLAEHVPDDWTRLERFEGQAVGELTSLRRKLTVRDRCG